MARTLFFPHAFTLGLGPGKAAEIRAGDVIKGVPDEFGATLATRFGATDKLPAGAEPIGIDRRLLDDGVAAKISHPHVEERLKPTPTEMLAEAIKGQGDAFADALKKLVASQAKP